MNGWLEGQMVGMVNARTNGLHRCSRDWFNERSI